MAKKKFNKPKEKYNGYVYVLKVWFDNEVVYKIGTTNRTPVTRMLELAGDFYRMLGHIPKMTLVRQKQTGDNYQVEAAVLKATEKWLYTLACEMEMNGESELRKMDEGELLRTYDLCIAAGYEPVEDFKVEL